MYIDVCVCESVHQLVNRIFHQPLGKFHHIYNFGALGHKDELIRLWSQEVKGQSHDQGPDLQKILGKFLSLSLF